jgi:hypothetical protein
MTFMAAQPRVRLHEHFVADLLGRVHTNDI